MMATINNNSAKCNPSTDQLADTDNDNDDELPQHAQPQTPTRTFDSDVDALKAILKRMGRAKKQRSTGSDLNTDSHGGQDEHELMLQMIKAAAHKHCGMKPNRHVGRNERRTNARKSDSVVKEQSSIRRLRRDKQKAVQLQFCPSRMKQKQIENTTHAHVAPSPLQLTSMDTNVTVNTVITNDTSIDDTNANILKGLAPSLNTTTPVPPPSKLRFGLSCYICNLRSTQMHGFYDSMCVACGDANFKMRSLYTKTKLDDKVAIVTGGRVKIGYEIVMQLLATGCTVIATTRFLEDAKVRFSSIPHDWATRLHLINLDLRSSKNISKFCAWVKFRFGSVDILINNAAQTLKRKQEFYAPQLALEQRAHKQRQELASSPQPTSAVTSSPTLSTLTQQVTSASLVTPHTSVLPFVHDENGQPLDASLTNSWVQKLEEVSMAEVAEVQIINYLAPYQLIKELHSVMTKNANATANTPPDAPPTQTASSPSPVPTDTSSSNDEKLLTKVSCIVNVSSMEGKFYDHVKQPHHPHTNAAKAALNMLVRTSAPAMKADGILLTAVDTGWVTQMNPNSQSSAIRDAPIDEVDGASRVLHPVFAAFTDDAKERNFFSGVFMKDYKEATW